jgi:hypothetical protein
MPLMLDDMRAEFARVLAAQSATRFSMDKALAHVISLAYAAGIDDAQRCIALNPPDTTTASDHHGQS